MTCYARMLADDSMEGTFSHGLARDCVTIFIWRLVSILIWFTCFPIRSSARSELLVPTDWSCSPHWYSGGGTLLQLHPWPLLPPGAWSVVLVQWCWSEAVWSCTNSVRMLRRRNDSKCVLYTFFAKQTLHDTKKNDFDCTEIERVA